ncbi:armadillo-type protein [Mycena alexandri]|uniref:Armadillo-type protein n=1 Tax=Mycena alexandri TaxID=1745969 RepID=A0AAD6SP97_9AGAR|nr:armadillo-type protein [Mycena alexandri]
MPLEAIMMIIDNSECMRNGDYQPTRFDAQSDTVTTVVRVSDTQHLVLLIDERDEILENLEIAETRDISSFRLTTPDPSVSKVPSVYIIRLRACRCSLLGTLVCAKKWGYGVLGRLFHRCISRPSQTHALPLFGNPSQLPSAMQADYGNFAAHFVAVFAPEILVIYLRQVELYVAGQAWLSKKCQYQIFTFFTECIKPKSTWTLLKPHAQTLVETLRRDSAGVFPQLSFNAARQQLWESDPVDYVRVSVDEYESFATPVSAATMFLFSLASNRTKTMFMPILQFINRFLRSPAPVPRLAPFPRPAPFPHLAPLPPLTHRPRPAALWRAQHDRRARPWILRHPDVASGMEQFVGPEFACEVLGTMTKEGVKWTSDERQFRAVTAALDDQELPVRMQAALTLTEMVVLYDSVKTAVSPQVGKVIQDLLKLSDETDLDILNHSMEVMVEAFQTELLPVAAQLTARLCDSYLRLIKESLVAEELYADVDTSIEVIMVNADEDKTYAAMGVAKTIGTIITSIENAPEILAQVQEVIIPVITFTFKHKILDLFDNMYELVDSLTFKLCAISPNLWPVFELTYNLFKSDAVDFLEEMCTFFQIHVDQPPGDVLIFLPGQEDIESLEKAIQLFAHQLPPGPRQGAHRAHVRGALRRAAAPHLRPDSVQNAQVHPRDKYRGDRSSTQEEHRSRTFRFVKTFRRLPLRVVVVHLVRYSHPLTEARAVRGEDRGSVVYQAGLQDVLEPGSLSIDEGEGRITFMLRSHTRRLSNVVILEI